MKLDICICTNHELLSQAFECEPEAIDDAIRFAQQKCLELTGQFAQEDSCFRNWSGGRHHQFRHCVQFVSIPLAFSHTGLVDIADAIDNALAEECAAGQPC